MRVDRWMRSRHDALLEWGMYKYKTHILSACTNKEKDYQIRIITWKELMNIVLWGEIDFRVEAFVMVWDVIEVKSLRLEKMIALKSVGYLWGKICC